MSDYTPNESKVSSSLGREKALGMGEVGMRKQKSHKCKYPTEKNPDWDAYKYVMKETKRAKQ